MIALLGSSAVAFLRGFAGRLNGCQKRNLRKHTTTAARRKGTRCVQKKRSTRNPGTRKRDELFSTRFVWLLLDKRWRGEKSLVKYEKKFQKVKKHREFS